jgi:hypothetical protein
VLVSFPSVICSGNPFFDVVFLDGIVQVVGIFVHVRLVKDNVENLFPNEKFPFQR